jgi:hypothetical protein
MKGDNGKNPIKVKTDARQAVSAISEVVTGPQCLLSAMVDYPSSEAFVELLKGAKDSSSST